MNIDFTPHGKREFAALPRDIQKRIFQKLRENARLPDPLIRARPLVNLPPATHRFRIGKYRASFFIEDDVMYVEEIRLRDQAYRQ